MAFVVQGHRIELTIQDIYFLIVLPPLGVVAEIHTVLPRGRHIDEFGEHHCVYGSRAKGTTTQFDDLERLETRGVVNIFDAIDYSTIFSSPKSCSLFSSQVYLLENIFISSLGT